MNKLLVVCGPTATGKTDLALELAAQFNGELVSADSRQVYRGLDIGTGKDLPSNINPQASSLKVRFKERLYESVVYKVRGIPLWMYDVVSPDEEFSVAHYQILATEVISNIRDRGKLPIITGGTGLYIKSLLMPLGEVLIPPNPKLREQLSRAPLGELQSTLCTTSAANWAALNPSDRQNPRRLIRKIEIATYWQTHEPPEDEPTHEPDALVVGLTAPLAILYRRIDRRVEQRVSEGIIAEIRGLLEAGYSWHSPGLHSLGYRQWERYLDCRESNQEAVIQRWKFDEHAYARRQLTWFRHQTRAQWFDITARGYRQKVARLVRGWYTNHNPGFL